MKIQRNFSKEVYIPKNVLFDPHGLKLQHLVIPYENITSSMNFFQNFDITNLKEQKKIIMNNDNNLNVKTINNSNIKLTHAKLIMISAKCNP